MYLCVWTMYPLSDGPNSLIPGACTPFPTLEMYEVLSNSGKTTFIAGWIVPIENLHLKQQTDQNEKLVILGK